MPKIDLLPCPFCGRKPKTSELNIQLHQISCQFSKCHAHPCVIKKTPEEAAKAWNTRASSDIELDKRVRELKGRIDLFADNWLDEDERKDMEYYQTHFIADPIDLRYYEAVAKVVEEKFYTRFYDFFAERMIKNKQPPQRKDDTR